MRKKCLNCGYPIVKILGSNNSCINKDCSNYIPNLYDSNLITFFSYEDKEQRYSESTDVSSIEYNYIEEYDNFLFYSDNTNYISRYEYREMNNFIEDYLFKYNRIDRFKRYLDDEEISNFDEIKEKYKLINKGRELENNSTEEALNYYKSLLHNNLFKNDYYIYKKLLILEKDYKKQLDLIISFFNSGIYCNRYHYLWFLKKLKKLSKNIPISADVVDSCLNNFKNKSFTLEKFKYHPTVIAEKITYTQGKLKVRTDKEYTLRQYTFELQEEAYQLKDSNQLEYAISIFKKLILDYGFKSIKYFRKICYYYDLLGDKKNELKWIYGYFNKSRSVKFQDDLWFNQKLEKYNIPHNEFYHEKLFFDTNKYYLTKEDFKQNGRKSDEIWDYLVTIKEKYILIKKGLTLEKKENKFEAINYYISLLDNDLFKNDYYLYKSLVRIYDQIDYLDEAIETIFSFFKSGIYCDSYNYLFFISYLKKLSQELIVYDYEIDDHLKYFKENGFKNKALQNTPVTIAERIICKNKNINIVPEDEFEVYQEANSLSFIAGLFQANNMFNSANEIYIKLILEYGIYNENLFEKLLYNYQQLNDSKREKIMTQVLDRYLYKWDYYDQKWFNEVLPELNNSNIPNEESEIELFYEHNENYLTINDFNPDENFTDLIDRLRLKFSLKRQGRILEGKNTLEAIDFYKKLLENELFKNDYHAYRKLVLQYDKLNDYNKVFETIKLFFKSGIYCNRYQYIWFLHKLVDVSKVKFISDEEVKECLKSFKENGFQNKSQENMPVFLADRIFKRKSSIEVYSSESYYKLQKKYELKETVRQLELNGVDEESIKIFRNLIDNNCYSSSRDYMRLCHMYRRVNDYENELEIINKYLSRNTEISRSWFENRLNELTKLKHH